MTHGRTPRTHGTIAVSVTLPERDRGRPPIVLVHGAANSATVWRSWAPLLAADGWPSYAIDLRGHGASSATDLSQTSMHDYLDDVRRLIGQLRQRPVIVGWSMGGLIALMAAAEGLTQACVGLAPSTPAHAVDEAVPLRQGEFGPEEYGITSHDPTEQPAMPDLDHEERLIALGSLGRESRYARDERQRGIVVEALRCPLLIVTGTQDRQWPRERYASLHLAAEHLTAEGASHWGLVLNRRALAEIVPAVSGWLDQQASSKQIGGRGSASPLLDT